MAIFKNHLLLALSAAISSMTLISCEENTRMTSSERQDMQPAHRFNDGNGNQAGQSQQHVCSCMSEPKVALSQRPQIVQAAVDEAFECIKNTDDNKWLYNGSYEYYRTLNLDEEKVIQNIASENDAHDIYLLDVGCARGGWGMNAASFIRHTYDAGRASGGWCKKAASFIRRTFSNTAKHFHIFSITGGNECGEYVHTKGNVTLHQFNKFKIENLDEELIKRGYNLRNKVHLIVSNWTLRHLVRLYNNLCKWENK